MPGLESFFRDFGDSLKSGIEFLMTNLEPTFRQYLIKAYVAFIEAKVKDSVNAKEFLEFLKIKSTGSPKTFLDWFNDQYNLLVSQKNITEIRLHSDFSSIPDIFEGINSIEGLRALYKEHGVSMTKYALKLGAEILFEKLNADFKTRKISNSCASMGMNFKKAIREFIASMPDEESDKPPENYDVRLTLLDRQLNTILTEYEDLIVNQQKDVSTYFKIK